MFTLFRLISMRQILLEQMPAIGISWLVAELFYKFHSFTLECAAFLLTWFAVDAVLSALWSILSRGNKETHSKT